MNGGVDTQVIVQTRPGLTRLPGKALLLGGVVAAGREVPG